LCRGVSDRKVKAAIESGSNSVELIGSSTGAGTVCHECHPAIEEMLRAAREPDRPADLSAGRRSKGKGSTR
jgi:bacterioferritin-associated ferredoxin